MCWPVWRFSCPESYLTRLKVGSYWSRQASWLSALLQMKGNKNTVTLTRCNQVIGQQCSNEMCVRCVLSLSLHLSLRCIRVIYASRRYLCFVPICFRLDMWCCWFRKKKKSICHPSTLMNQPGRPMRLPCHKIQCHFLLWYFNTRPVNLCAFCVGAAQFIIWEC